MLAVFRFIAPLLFTSIIIVVENYFVFLKSGLIHNSLSDNALLIGCLKDLIFPFSLYSLFLLVNKAKSLHCKILSLLMSLTIFFIFSDYICYSITFERFNWSYMHDINLYSLKATMNLQMIFYVILFFIGLVALVRIYYLFILEYIQKSKLRFWVSASIFIFTVLLTVVVYLLPVKLYKPAGSAVTARSAIYKNLLLKGCAKGALMNFFKQPIEKKIATANKFIPYTIDGTKQLERLGLLKKNTPVVVKNQIFKKIILLVLEGVPISYFHYYNDNIPSEASYFIDKLLEKFPHFDNYYTSEAPTNKGIFAMVASRIPANPNFMRFAHYKSVFEIFNENVGDGTYFIRGTSKYYGGEFRTIKDVYKVNHLIAQEELSREYPPVPITDWGFHNKVVYSKVIDVLERNREKPLFILAKTIDMHQPPYYCGIPRDKLPLEIKNHKSPIIPSLYWANKCLEYFFREVESKKLLDDETLIVITSDHHPLPGWGHAELVKSDIPIYKERLPLIFISKNRVVFDGVDTKQIMSQIDLPATICSLMGVKQPNYFMGQSVFAKNRIPFSLLFHEGVFMYDNGKTPKEFSFNDIEEPVLGKWAANIFAIK